MRRGVLRPGPIEIHCANRLSSSTIVSAQSACPLCRASTSRSFVCGRCTPVHPGDFAFGDRTSSGESWTAGGLAAEPAGVWPAVCAPAAAIRTTSAMAANAIFMEVSSRPTSSHGGRALAARGPPLLRLGLLEWLETSRLAVWLGESPSVWAAPTVLTLHTTGMAVLVGASWVLDL